MPALVSLGDLVARVRAAAEQENSEFCSDDEIKRRLLTSLGRIYKEVVRIGQEAVRSTRYIEALTGEPIVDLPDDFYRLLAVMVSDRPGGFSGIDRPVFGPAQGTQWTLCEPFMMQEIAGLLNTTGGCGPPSYRTRGGETVRQLELLPSLTSDRVLRVEYIPVFDATDLSDGREVDGFNGHEEIAVCEAALYCLGKEGRSNKFLLDYVRDEWAQLRETSPAIDRSRSERVVDIYNQGGFRRHGRRPW